MTHLILVRHAEAEGNMNRRFHGVTNSDLTDNGHRQAEKLAQRLDAENIDAIYSSDLSRAYQTAKHIADIKGIVVNVIKGLREIDGGEWENELWDVLPKRGPEIYHNWENNPHLVEMPRGETMAEMQERAIIEIDNLINSNSEKSICVVTHGTLLKALLCHIYKKPLSEFNNIAWHDNASITMIHVDKDIFNVIIEGDNKHLGELSTLAKQDWWKKK